MKFYDYVAVFLFADVLAAIVVSIYNRPDFLITGLVAIWLVSEAWLLYETLRKASENPE